MKRLFVLYLIVLFSFPLFGQNETITGPTIKKEKKISYYQSADIGFGFGASEKHNLYCKPQPWSVFVNETHGIQFNPHLMLGLNIGFMYISPAACNSQYHNIYFSGGLDFRYTILKNKWSPFLMLNLGSGIDIFLREGASANRMRAQYLREVKASVYAGYRYKFGQRKEVYCALGIESLFWGPALRIGARF
jgi:hypothetical protein